MEISVARVSWRPRKPWMVHYRPHGTTGPQVRLFFRTKLEAEGRRRQLLLDHGAHGNAGMVALTPAEVHEFREAKKLAGAADLRDVARDWAARTQPNATVPTLADALEAWREALAGLSGRYLETTKVVGKIVAAIGPMRVDDLTAQQIEEAIPLGQAAAVETLANRRRMMGTFMAHCVRMGWRHDDPMPRVRRWRVQRRTPEFYTVEEVATLLRVLREREPRLVPAMALRLFAGLRTQELARIVRMGYQADIQPQAQRILIRAEVAKGRKSAPRPRLIEGLPPTVWPWLALGELEWPVHAPRLVRDALGDRVRRLKNGPRHTFATYAVAYYDSAEAAARKLGNSSGVALRHYVGVASKAEATAFFGIVPGAAV